MNAWQENFMRGYNSKHIGFFNDFCKNSYGVFGDVSQAGVIEVNSKGESIVIANRPDVGWNCLEHRIWERARCFSFFKNFSGEHYTIDSASHYYDPDANKFKLQIFAFMLRSQKDKETQRIGWLAGDTPEFHNKLVNNFFMAKLLLKGLLSEVGDIVQQSYDNTINMAELRPDYFIDGNFFDGSELEKINHLLQDVKIMDNDKRISSREWDCLQLYSYSKSAKETGKVLDISRRTVESHFHSMMEKLQVNSKSDVLAVLEKVTRGKI